MSDNGKKVSNHPLTPLVEREQALHTWIAALVLVAVVFELWRILTGQDKLDGALTIQELQFPWIIFVFPAALLIYWHQSWVSLVRPTGGGKGFWYGLLDFVPSLAVLVITGGAIASWFSPYVGRRLAHWHLPVAPFEAVTVLVAAVFFVLALLDVIYFHWRRAKYGREVLIAERAAAQLPPDRNVVVLDRNQYPHGYEITARRPDGGLVLKT